MSLDEFGILCQQQIIGLVVTGEIARIDALTSGEIAKLLGEPFHHGCAVEIFVSDVNRNVLTNMIGGGQQHERGEGSHQQGEERESSRLDPRLPHHIPAGFDEGRITQQRGQRPDIRERIQTPCSNSWVKSELKIGTSSAFPRMS